MPTNPAIATPLQDVARDTRLMVYGELKQLFEDALQAPDDVARIVTALGRGTVRMQPAIRLLPIDRVSSSGRGTDRKKRRRLERSHLLSFSSCSIFEWNQMVP